MATKIGVLACDDHRNCMDDYYLNISLSENRSVKVGVHNDDDNLGAEAELFLCINAITLTAGVTHCTREYRRDAQVGNLTSSENTIKLGIHYKASTISGFGQYWRGNFKM